MMAICASEKFRSLHDASPSNGPNAAKLEFSSKGSVQQTGSRSLAVAAGAPMSTALLELSGVWGLAGWKWMFIAEAIPTVLVGIFLLFCVSDRPHLTQWLSAAACSNGASKNSRSTLKWG
jgi:sugar phosphate permease